VLWVYFAKRRKIQMSEDTIMMRMKMFIPSDAPRVSTIPEEMFNAGIDHNKE
jgi:hypothetical protein